MFLFIYNIFIRVFYLGVRIAGTWNPKARLWWRGRRNLFSALQEAFRGNTRSVVWMHCASLGEFEQGRFLLENIRIRFPETRILLTFFSSSGYEPMKNYKGADDIFYLPLPTKKFSEKFISITNPALVLWIKYDYWYHYLQELSNRKTPLLLVSAIFQRHHPFFKWYSPLYKKMLRCFTWLFVQTPESATRLKVIGFSGNITVNGDTRFDRVIDIAENFIDLPVIREFCGANKVIVAGSTWSDDEEALAHYANENVHTKFIIAPHETDDKHLAEISKLFRSSVRYSDLLKTAGSGQGAGKNGKPVNTLVIDNIGMLSRLYYYATVTYVGGGFGDDGVHNVLEAAVYGKPVVFGPVFNKFREAIDLLEEGAATTVDNAIELETTFNDLLNKQEDYTERCEAAKNYVYSRKGATWNIMNYIQENRLLTS